MNEIKLEVVKYLFSDTNQIDFFVRDGFLSFPKYNCVAFSYKSGKHHSNTIGILDLDKGTILDIDLGDRVGESHFSKRSEEYIVISFQEKKGSISSLRCYSVSDLKFVESVSTGLRSEIDGVYTIDRDRFFIICETPDFDFQYNTNRAIVLSSFSKNKSTSVCSQIDIYKSDESKIVVSSRTENIVFINSYLKAGFDSYDSFVEMVDIEKDKIVGHFDVFKGGTMFDRIRDIAILDNYFFTNEILIAQFNREGRNSLLLFDTETKKVLRKIELLTDSIYHKNSMSIDGKYYFFFQKYEEEQRMKLLDLETFKIHDLEKEKKVFVPAIDEGNMSVEVCSIQKFSKKSSGEFHFVYGYECDEKEFGFESILSFTNIGIAKVTGLSLIFKDEMETKDLEERISFLFGSFEEIKLDDNHCIRIQLLNISIGNVLKLLLY